jgi:MoCo/4Fe-4S cofactor protein with predicted Tat translocation signal
MTKDNSKQLDIAALRQKLADAKGPQFWRSIEEVAETPEFQEFLQREFPRGASEWSDQASRRSFLKLMGASLALAGLAGCAPANNISGVPSPAWNPFNMQNPQEKLVPFVRQPENVIPGKPLFFATAMPWRGYALGALAESYDGRPTKIEGNPLHPTTLGGTNVFMQASVLSLYDPDRSVAPLKGGAPAAWADFVAELQGQIGGLGDGAGLRILSGAVTSPTLIGQVEQVLARFPQARWLAYEPINHGNAYQGAQLAFGQPVDTVYNFAEARVVLALDSDFLFALPGSVRYARDWAETRRVGEEKQEMSRLYVVESTPTITGAMADHRIGTRPTAIESFARAIARALGVQVAQELDGTPNAVHSAWIGSLVADLQANQGASIVIAGEEQPPAVHAIAHAINEALGNVGTTVSYVAPLEGVTGDQVAELATLVADMNSGAVTTLLMLGGNPAFDAPADLGFAEALPQVPFSAHLSLYQDETSSLATWHINAAHYLESWGDARAHDGTPTVVQPLINPLYVGKTPYELIQLLVGGEQSAYNLVRAYWQGQVGGDFENSWQAALHDGLVQGITPAAASVTLDAAGVGAIPAGGEPEQVNDNVFEIVFRPDPTIWDGSYANNGWLQELPKPFSKLTWDNAALVSPHTAERLNLANGELLTLTLGERSIQAAAWIMPKHPDETVSLYLGHGRTRAGRVGNGTGFNAYALRTTSAMGFATGLSIAKAGGSYQLVSTQVHHVLDGREILKIGTLEQFQADQEFLQHGGHKSYDLRPGEDVWVYDGNKWGMVIDTNVCIGCNACVVACQSENNIPVVGKDQVSRGREMHWLRIDEYYEGNLDDPRIYYQPMACQQCEQAPCEVVCPVAATVHDAEGINNMVYNRCVGTRYCSNNCPYKVRRFNFLQYNDLQTPVIMLGRNPNVTVRNRGVMEKCNYCIQRINAARIEAKKEQRAIADGEVVTACQGACPTRAIVFGNYNDPEAEATKLAKHPLHFDVLGAELNTRPRTIYLARLNNFNAEIPEEGGGEAHA